MSRAAQHARLGDTVFASVDKTNSELVALLYGTLVTQLIKDIEDVDAVNAELDRLGFDTGVRMIEEFLAKTQLTGCADFQETCEVIAKVGFRIFLGVSGDVCQVEQNGSVCHIALPNNPFYDFVELPPSLDDLVYSAFVCGVIRGALEQVQMRVSVTVVQDMLHGADKDEFRVELLELLKDTFIDPDDA